MSHPESLDPDRKYFDGSVVIFLPPKLVSYRKRHNLAEVASLRKSLLLIFNLLNRLGSNQAVDPVFVI